MSRWTFIAQRAVTGEFLDWDVPIAIDSLEWELSAPGSLKGTVDPDSGGLRGSDDRPILEEWGTLLYAESGGEIRWGGVVVACSFEGDSWHIEAAGFSTYPHARTYRGEYARVGVDPAEVIRHIWAHLQSFPDANLGVTVIGDSTPARLGKLAYATDENGVVLDLAIPHKEWEELFNVGWIGGPVHKVHVSAALWPWLLNNGFIRVPDDTLGEVVVPPATWAEEFPWWESEILNLGWVGGPVRKQDVRPELFTFLSGHGWASKSIDAAPPDYNLIYPPTMNDAVLQSDDTVTEAAPYTLLWWESPNCGEEIATLVKSTPLDYVERHRWAPDGESVIHEIELGYPRIGRRRDDIAFVQGDNVTKVVTVDSNGDEFANTVLGLGAGEGQSMLRRETSIRDGRLARDHVYADKAVTDSGRLDALIADELNARKAALRITSLDVTEHPNAPIGAWQLGDDVLVRATLPWLGDVEMWVRVTGWSLTGEHTATLTVSRSDLFSYGG